MDGCNGRLQHQPQIGHLVCLPGSMLPALWGPMRQRRHHLAEDDA